MFRLDEMIEEPVEVRSAIRSVRYVNITEKIKPDNTPATDAELRDRATHTGFQPISSVAGLAEALVVSDEPLNRLERSDKGLYVHDDFNSDPLAYYILAKG
jgi:hypothetical protein